MNTQYTIITLVVLVMLSAFFSATETAFSSLNKIRLKNMANNGNRKAARTVNLAENYSKLISTVLIGNNIVNIASASLATVLFVGIFDEAGIGLSTIVMTIVVLIFGEITPKNIAKEMPEQYAMAVTPIIGVLITLMTPLNFFFDLWKKMINRIFNITKDEGVTSDELVTMVEEAQNEGGLDEHESDLIVAAIEFNDLEVKEILTPRVDVISLNLAMEFEEIAELFSTSGFSRLPVFENTIDNIIGIIHEKDFYHLYYRKKHDLIETIVKDIVFTSPQMKVSALLRQLQSSKSHLAIVLDEYGGTAGIITMEDILEELVGEIYDEHDEIEEDYKQIDDNTFLVECDSDLEDMFEHLGFVNDVEYDFITVSGWIIHMLNRIPEIGDSFEFKNITVTITDSDTRKVNQAKIEVMVDDEEPEPSNKKKSK